MLNNARLFFFLLGMACAIFLLLGLLRPWAMLWWEDTQNRKKIFLVYGTLTVVFLAIYYGLKFLK